MLSWRLIVTTGFHGFLAMTSAFYLTTLNSLDVFIKSFANESLERRFGHALSRAELGKMQKIKARRMLPAQQPLGLLPLRYFSSAFWHHRHWPALLRTNLGGEFLCKVVLE